VVAIAGMSPLVIGQARKARWKGKTTSACAAPPGVGQVKIFNLASFASGDALRLRRAGGGVIRAPFKAASMILIDGS
jgi:hypothetical protein